MAEVHLERAYQILGVPPSASAHSIKQAYRRMLKRWHPDLYAAAAAQHAEATEMTRLINEAYSAIAHAPLRYQREMASTLRANPAPAAPDSARDPSVRHFNPFPMPDRLEFCIRFVLGALFGILLGFRLVLFYSESPGVLAVGVLTTAAVLGLAAARYGDRFWHQLLRLWWLWS
jgi:hypothetical protein